jgi:hypothetical protein
MDYTRLILLALFTVAISCIANLVSAYTGYSFNIEIVAAVFMLGYVAGIGQMVLLYKKQVAKIISQDDK